MLMKIDSRRRDISEIVYSIRLLQGVSRNRLRESVRKHRITGQQLGALRFVALSPGISMRELSEQLYLHISTVSGIVDRLEKKGYVARERGGEDRRIVHLVVTANGRRAIRRLPLVGMGRLIHTIDQLPTGQLRDILKGLRLLLNIMRIKGRRRYNM
jgi:DNA-binding MarR family transcriptional regulator